MEKGWKQDLEVVLMGAGFNHERVFKVTKEIRLGRKWHCCSKNWAGKLSSLVQQLPAVANSPDSHPKHPRGGERISALIHFRIWR